MAALPRLPLFGGGLVLGVLLTGALGPYLAPDEGPRHLAGPSKALRAAVRTAPLVGAAALGPAAGPAWAAAPKPEDPEGERSELIPDSMVWGPDVRGMEELAPEGIENFGDLEDVFTSGLSSSSVYIYFGLAFPLILFLALFLAQTGAATTRISEGLAEAKAKKATDESREARVQRLYPKKPTTTTAPAAGDPEALPPPAQEQPKAEPAPLAPKVEEGSLEAEFREELRRRADNGTFPEEPTRADPSSPPFDSDDLQGLPSRVVRLLGLGTTFWLSLWPLVAGVLVSVLVTFSLFGSSFIHTGSTPRPVVYDLTTLEPLPAETRRAPPPP